MVGGDAPIFYLTNYSNPVIEARNLPQTVTMRIAAAKNDNESIHFPYDLCNSLVLTIGKK
jgi:hypothetical protein